MFGKFCSNKKQCLKLIKRESTPKSLKSGLQCVQGGAPLIRRMTFFCKTNNLKE